MSRPIPLSGSTFSIFLALVWIVAFPVSAESDTIGTNSDYIVTKRLLSIENGLASFGFEMKEGNDLPVDFRTGPLNTFIQEKALLKLNNQERQYLISSVLCIKGGDF